MYNNSTQYPGQNYQSAYPQYQQTYNTGYGYQGYGQQYMNTATQPAPPGGDNYPQTEWAPTAGYAPTPQQDDKKEAVAQEMKQQKAQLVKQREEYVKKASVLRRELDQLRNQKQDLLAAGSTDRDLEVILNENDKLQEEIQGKLKAIHNVIEMLSSIIKDGRKMADLEASLNEDGEAKSRRKDSEEVVADINSRYCYVHYDTGLHWCRVCDDFPDTAKEFLLHLQAKKHLENAKENDVGDNTPWHKLPAEPILPANEDLEKKRIPIKGLQFFISAPSWYCKLCDVWIGDLHCASHHLKSQSHFQNYNIFVQQNPHWEMEWLKDREKAMTRNGKHNSSGSDEDGASKRKKKRKEKRAGLDSKEKKRKKKKKRRKHSSESSSSSSSSDTTSEDEQHQQQQQNDKSKSIRVEMRNRKVEAIMNEEVPGKWSSMLEKLVEEHKKKGEKKDEPDHLISQWMTVSEPPDKDRNMLNNLKDRMKVKQDIEKARYAEIEKKRLDKEREDRELFEAKQRQAREAAEEAERMKKRKEQEEYDRLRDKDRNHVKFRTRDNYRRHNDSRSDDEGSPRHKHYRQSSPNRHRDRKGSNRDRSRSRSSDRKGDSKKKPPGPPSYRKLPFIGRMPLFKNKKPEDRTEVKEIKKEDYEPQRRTRFQPGNLARAFIPSPDVVCFPKLSCYPPLEMPPPEEVIVPPPPAPEPPKITAPVAPPPPKINHVEEELRHEEEDDDEEDEQQQVAAAIDNHDYSEYYNMMYSNMYEYSQEEQMVTAPPPPDVPHSHTMPLLPPPLPPSEPEDDLAMLGMCADDMAAQSF